MASMDVNQEKKMKKLAGYFSDEEKLKRIFKKNGLYYEVNKKATLDELRVTNTLSPQMICVLFNKKGKLVGFSVRYNI